VSKAADGGLRPGLASWPLAAAGACHRGDQHRDAVAAEDPDMRAHGGDEPRARTFRRWITCVLILSLTGAPPAIPQHTGPRHIDLVPPVRRASSSSRPRSRTLASRPCRAAWPATGPAMVVRRGDDQGPVIEAPRCG
jgi:hypothetical protein